MIASQLLALTSKLPPRLAAGIDATSPFKPKLSLGLISRYRAPNSTSTVDSRVDCRRHSPAMVQAEPLRPRSRSAVTDPELLSPTNLISRLVPKKIHHY